VRLKEHGAAQLRFDGEHGGVEAFKVAGLQDAVVLLTECDQLVCLRECGGDGLFYEEVQAALKQRRGHGVMMHGGDGDAGRVKMKIGGEQRFRRGEDGDGVLRGNFSGASGVRLKRGDECDRLTGRLKLAIDTKVVAPEGTRAGYGDSRDGTAGYLPASFPSTALRQRV
jgi:hypothetical protein